MQTNRFSISRACTLSRHICSSILLYWLSGQQSIKVVFLSLKLLHIQYIKIPHSTKPVKRDGHCISTNCIYKSARTLINVALYE